MDHFFRALVACAISALRGVRPGPRSGRLWLAAHVLDVAAIRADSVGNEGQPLIVGILPDANWGRIHHSGCSMMANGALITRNGLAAEIGGNRTFGRNLVGHKNIGAAGLVKHATGFFESGSAPIIAFVFVPAILISQVSLI